MVVRIIGFLLEKMDTWNKELGCTILRNELLGGNIMALTLDLRIFTISLSLTLSW